MAEVLRDLRAGRRARAPALRRAATDPVTALVLLALTAAAASLAGMTMLSWGALGALAGYSLSGSV